jgi:hypothetical protein
MASRALIAAVSNYALPGDKLEGAVPEAKRWATLLTTGYKIPVTLLLDEDATREAVDRELRALLSQSSSGDLLVFVFCGHGVKVRVDGNVADEALVLYPGDTENGVLNATAFTETQFARVLEEHPLNGAILTLVLETCFSGGFELTPVWQALWRVGSFFGFRKRQILSLLRNANPDVFREVRAFGSLADSPEAAGRPLVVAACRPGARAAQRSLSPFTQAGMVFSHAAIPVLTAEPAITHLELIDRINPLDADTPPQEATLNGNRVRERHQFFK